MASTGVVLHCLGAQTFKVYTTLSLRQRPCSTLHEPADFCWDGKVSVWSCYFSRPLQNTVKQRLLACSGVTHTRRGGSIFALTQHPPNTPTALHRTCHHHCQTFLHPHPNSCSTTLSRKHCHRHPRTCIPFSRHSRTSIHESRTHVDRRGQHSCGATGYGTSSRSSCSNSSITPFQNHAASSSSSSS